MVGPPELRYALNGQWRLAYQVLEDAGEHELKGVPERWHLYRVAS